MVSFRLRIYSFLLFLLGVPCLTAYDPTWCGNKHANLVRLQSIPVPVPTFFGVNTGRVEEFLQAHAPEIFDDYRWVVSQLNPNYIYQKPVPTGFVAQFINAASTALFGEKVQDTEDTLSSIQEKIKNCFINHPFPFTSGERATIQRVLSQNKFFMVRSTGIEDSQTTANAGGNSTIAYVSPNEKNIQEAMGHVVASYFSMHSLKNRIAGGEQLLPTELCIPVLVQILIDANIPVSGVAFTTRDCYSSPDFPVTEINTSYGHGEGIVANRVPADKYYITPSRHTTNDLFIQTTLTHKPERLAPTFNIQTQKHELTLIKNSDALAHSSSLSEQEIRQLYTMLKKIEQEYQQPMDVEFVVADSQIYIVQARPAMKHAANPTYCDLQSIPQNAITTPCELLNIVPGKSELLIISYPTEIIIANTLDEADQMPNSASCKAVIVGNFASSLSHAAVNFMSHGIACSATQSLATIKKMVSSISPSTPLIIDVQRKIAFQWLDQQSTITPFIHTGWFEHPITGPFSVFLKTIPTCTAHANPIPQDAVLINLLDTFKKASNSERLALVPTITTRIHTRLSLTERRFKLLNDPELQNAFKQFQNKCTTLLAEITTALHNNASSFEILYYHKLLETILFQEAHNTYYIGTFNYSYFLNDLIEKNKILGIIKKIGHNAQFLQEFTYVKYCPSSAIAEPWKQFVLTLEVIAKTSHTTTVGTQIALLRTMLQKLEQANCLSLWFATEFYQTIQQQPIDTLASHYTLSYVHNLLSTFTAKYTAHTLGFLEKLIALKKTCASLNHQQQFTSAKAVHAYWQQVKQSVIEPLTHQDFVTNINQAPNTIKLLACDTMHACTHLIDSSIKTVKTSNLPWRDKELLFKELLTDFHTVFKTWIQQVMPEAALDYHFSWPLSRYVSVMNREFNSIINTSLTARMLQRSATFSVNAAMLGSKTAFERHYPNTAEDMLMLIHQNTLVAISGLSASCFTGNTLSQQLYLPAIMQQLVTHIDNCPPLRNQYPIRRIGIRYTAEMIEAHYNITLNNHSATFQVLYNTSTQECSLAVQFLGEARERWEQIAVLAAISQSMSGLTVNGDVTLDKSGGMVSWSWIITQPTEFPIVINYLGAMADITFGATVKNWIKSLYNSSQSFDRTYRAALAAYRTRYGQISLNLNDYFLP